MDTHIGCAMSGLTADARTLIDHGRVEAQVRCISGDVGESAIVGRGLLREDTERLSDTVRRSDRRSKFPLIDGYI